MQKRAKAVPLMRKQRYETISEAVAMMLPENDFADYIPT